MQFTRSSRSGVMTRTIGALSLLTCLAAVAGCGGSVTKPASPSGTTSTLTIRVYSSATGEIPQANFTVKASSSSALIRLADIRGVTGVDPQRAALRRAHSGNAVGSLAAKTTDGVISVAVNGDANYDLFLMSTANGANYTCLDIPGQIRGALSGFVTLARTTSGTMWNCPVVDGPDEPFQFGVDQFNEAMNPFGVRFGFITYAGTISSGSDMTGAWTPI